MVVAFKISDETVRVVVKGAPEEIMLLCTKQLNSQNQEVDFSKQNTDDHLNKVSEVISNDTEILKALSYAYCDWATQEFDKMSLRLNKFEKETDRKELEKNLTFAATFWLKDPLRENVKKTLSDLKNAGTSTVILSGDHEATVVKTIEELGLNDIEGGKRCISGEKFRNVMAPHYDKD